MHTYSAFLEIIQELKELKSIFLHSGWYKKIALIY